jgi:threonine dehydrogenase-like Zn-dependent dehydrogenase
MRALVYTESRELVVRDVPTPLAGRDEVIVRVEAAGICASDVHAIRSRSERRTPPLIMGHELTGRVVEVGDAAPRDLLGARVVVNPQVTCGDCRWCRSGRENVCGHRSLIGGDRPGGFAELVAVPLRCLHHVPEDATTLDVVFAEPLATCLHALTLAPDRFAATVVVLGGGTIGTLAAQLLRATGAQHVTVSEPLRDRHDALSNVADVVVVPDELESIVAEVTAGVGVELTVDAVGTVASRPQSLSLLCPGGSALWLGMHAHDGPIPGFDVVVREQRVIGSFAYTNSEFARALGLLGRGLLTPAVSTRSLALEESDATLRRLVEGHLDDVLKEVVCPV